MDEDFVFVGVLTIYLKLCAPCGGRHPPVPARGLFSQLSLWLGRASTICCSGSAQKVDFRVTWGASGDYDATTAVCVAMCCCTISVDSCVVAIPVLLQCVHGYYMVR